MAKTDIRSELIAAAGGLEQEPKEKDPAFGKRIAETIDAEVSEDDYEKLSQSAKDWYAKALEAVAAGKGFALPEAAAPAAKKAAAAPAPAAKKAAAKKAAPEPDPEPKPAPAAKKAPPAKEAKEPRTSVTREAIVMLAKKPKMSKADLEKALADKGMTLGPLAAVYARTKLALDTYIAIQAGKAS